MRRFDPNAYARPVTHAKSEYSVQPISTNQIASSPSESLPFTPASRPPQAIKGSIPRYTVPCSRPHASSTKVNTTTLRSNSANNTMTTSTRTADFLPSSCSSAPKELANETVVSEVQIESSLERSAASMIAPSHTPTYPSHNTALPDQHDCQQLTTEEKLREAQGQALKPIRLRIRAKDKENTTSLKDLDIARRQIQDISPVGSNIALAKAGGLPLYVRTNVHDTSLEFRRENHNQRNSSLALTSTHDNSLKAQIAQVFENPKIQKRKKKSKSNEVCQATQETSDSPWISSIGLKPVEMDSNSNACGSPILSDATQASDDSLQKLHSGKAIHAQTHFDPHSLVGWDGTFQPPPTDWDDRPRFDGNDPEFHGSFAQWNEDVCQMTIGESELLFNPIRRDIMLDYSSNADGISMVPQYTVINRHNASHYGYTKKNMEDVIKYANPISPNDFSNWGTLDLSRPENIAIKDETTEQLVSNWMKHKEEHRRLVESQVKRQEEVVEALTVYRSTPNPHKPKIGIYLRPASRVDASQMAEIYNWYIENSARPVETRPIDEEDMLGRLDDVQSTKLPFIVAVDRSMHSAIPYDLEAEAEAMKTSSHPIKNIDPRYKPLKAKEKIVGWACAQDFSAADYVEHISAELEVYVDPSCRQLGVGRCLMDAILESCDRGYMRRGGYTFQCPPEYKHLYSGGGGRNLHKLIFIVRKWKHPQKNVSYTTTAQNRVKANMVKKADDQENDYEMWLKDWLESWDFEVEGVLKGVGAKGGRFLDLVHFSRETRWQPNEGRIPEPFPGF